ncbi:MAG: hypothetical protein KF773_07380 [Deltaproteobacteria bacterium]|nr:hypothetical protein [Deltaproteobacteria bacterium]
MSALDGEDEELLIEQVAGAFRPWPLLDGELRYHPVWHDLSPAARERAHDRATTLRRAEAALDHEHLSSTARAVLARIP